MMILEMPVRLDFPTDPDSPLGEYFELIDAEHLDGNRYRLRSHSGMVPLAPDDVVVVEGGAITAVESQADVWLIEVFFIEDVAEDRTQRWGRDLPVSLMAPMVLRLSSSTKEWVDAMVVTDPMVDAIDLLRRPDQRIDLAEEIAKHARG